jgi:hypothetical protein
LPKLPPPMQFCFVYRASGSACPVFMVPAKGEGDYGLAEDAGSCVLCCIDVFVSS